MLIQAQSQGQQRDKDDAAADAEELREQELLDLPMAHAGQMDRSSTEIVGTVAQVNASQLRVAAMVDEVGSLLHASLDDLDSTDAVLETIQSIASNTQMLGLNAAIRWG